MLFFLGRFIRIAFALNWIIRVIRTMSWRTFIPCSGPGDPNEILKYENVLFNQLICLQLQGRTFLLITRHRAKHCLKWAFLPLSPQIWIPESIINIKMSSHAQILPQVDMQTTTNQYKSWPDLDFINLMYVQILRCIDLSCLPKSASYGCLMKLKMQKESAVWPK